ncbi:MAG: hypothetical protein KAT04_14460 [Methylococcales bacterium]|nr:hypothetical protein [Methylococcales bacterium]
MKTVEEKASEVINDSLCMCSESALEARIIKLLKEQDRDTRRACAEAVLNCPEDMSSTNLKDCAHNACINVKAV